MGWGSWFNVSGGAAQLGSPINVVARNPNHLDLFVTGTDGRIYSTWWDATTGWASWFNVSGGAAELGSPVTAVARNPNHLDLFVTGTDGMIYSTWWDAASGWASWFNVSGGSAQLGSPINVVARNPNHLDLFVTGTDGRIYSTWWDATTGWANWFNVSGGSAQRGSPINVVARNPNQLDLFVTGTDGRIYSTWWHQDNARVTHDTDPNHARSESSLVINPNAPTQIVAASKKFNNVQTYDFTLATGYSTDGGASWHDSASLAMPGFTVMTDPTMAWDDVVNVFLVGLPGTNPPRWDAIGMVVYKSTDGGQTWSAPTTIHQSPADDKQWAAGDTYPASPHHGNVYAVWDDNPGIRFARTTDHGATWIGSGTAASGSVITSGSVYPEINVGDDGTVCIVSIAGSEIRLLVSTDGGNSFHSAASPATGITPLNTSLPIIDGWPVLPGGIFRVLTDPTACALGKTITVGWADHREGVSRIYFARSTDGGGSWETGPSGQPLLSDPVPGNLHHFHPQIVTDPNGAIGCSFYEFGPKLTTPLIDVVMGLSLDGARSFTHFTVTDQPWDPTIDAPWVHGDSKVTFIGDYMGLDASQLGFQPLWTDTRTGIQELWTTTIAVPGINPLSLGTTVLKGTYTFDLETGVEGGVGATVDMWWEQVDQTVRRLVPQNGALLAHLGQPDFDSLTLLTLHTAPFAAAPIDGSNNSANRLIPGSVIAVKTGDGHFAKLRIESYGYNLTITWMTYR